MHRILNRLRAGQRPHAFSTGNDDYGSTVLVCSTGSIHIDGTLPERRKAAQAFAEAVGLSVVDTSRPVVLPARAPRDREHLHTT